MKFRIEEDSLGKVRVPRNALWGAQTQRAIDNFPISGISMNFPFTNTFISMLGYVKDAAARAMSETDLVMTCTNGNPEIPPSFFGTTIVSPGASL